jgi:hypothetical protein
MQLVSYILSISYVYTRLTTCLIAQSIYQRVTALTVKVLFPEGSRDISIFHSVLTGSGVYPVGTGALSRVGKPAERKTDYSPPPSAEVKSGGAIALPLLTSVSRNN